ncbi:hypothetical protein Rhopal_003047-T1 [Rhodotorula paludigena]|uniref:ATP-dependent Clp protease proteolytic subunit n=1 Tax=Rhodotorula paludigena TaxID=86838 RepID=A0AAV5GLB3_9BASI|nr:hypothetical protein Rhopal_003047-T1 [Rhodotorula paludigena]
MALLTRPGSLRVFSPLRSRPVAPLARAPPLAFLAAPPPRLSARPLARQLSSSGARRALIPYVVTREERIVFLNGPIEDALSSVVVAQLLFLEAESSAPISLYINSPGGSVTAGMAIYDTMQFVHCPVHTIVVGQASSMASLILAGEPSGGAGGQASDISIVANEILRIREKMFDLYADHCKLPHEERETTRERFARMLDRDHYLVPMQAIEQGIIDQVLTKRPSAPPSSPSPAHGGTDSAEGLARSGPQGGGANIP